MNQWAMGGTYSKISLRTKKHLERIMAEPLGDPDELEAWVFEEYVAVCRKNNEKPVVKVTREIWDSFRGGPN